MTADLLILVAQIELERFECEAHNAARAEVVAAEAEARRKLDELEAP